MRQPSVADTAQQLHRLASPDDRPRLTVVGEPETTEPAWTGRHSTRRQRIIDQLEEARGKLDQASDPKLSRHAIRMLLRDAAIAARRASNALTDLALDLER